MKRIILTGAQGTGKTTILNHFKEQGMNCITEVVRKLAKNQGVKINECGDIDGQQIIFNTYKDILSQQNDYISDRGLTDVVAYTTYLRERNSNLNILMLLQLMSLKEFNDKNDDIIYCYFPIEFDVVDDGVRSIDEEFRKEIDSNIKKLLDTIVKDYYIIRGTVEERIKQLESIIANN